MASPPHPAKRNAMRSKRVASITAARAILARSVRCLGWILAGIGCVALFVIAASAVIAGIIALAAFTSVTFDLPNTATAPIAFVYVLLGFGIAVGIGLCRDNR